MTHFKKNFLEIKAVPLLIGAMAAMSLLCSCGQPDYPEDADSLPTYTTRHSAQVIMETDTSPAVTTPKRTTAETTVSVTQIFGTGDYTSDTETAATTAPGSSEETGVTTVPGYVPSLEDVPEVGISDYYKGTQTVRTVPAVTTTPGVTTSIVTATSAVSMTTVSDTAAVSDTAEELIDDETPEYTVAAVSDGTLHERLTDGRKSRYTGRDIVSHPQSYYSLDERSKQLYDRVVSALLRHDLRMEFNNEDAVTFEEFFDMYQLIYNDEYRLFYISNQIEYYTDRTTGYLGGVSLKYTYTKLQSDAMQAEIDARCDEIMASVTPAMDDYGIVKLIHDSIVTGCRYLEGKDMNTIYGCLVTGEALCQGYSRSLMYLCGEAGIVSYGVFGEANGPHMWNVVEMDGEFYHVDCTWDDPDRGDCIHYDYFGLTDTRIRELRETEEYTYDIPAAAGTQYQYYSYNNLVAHSPEEAEEIIRLDTLAAAREKRSTVQFMCSDDTVYSAVAGQLFASTGRNILVMLEEAVPYAENRYDTESIQHSSNDKTRVIKFYLAYDS